MCPGVLQGGRRIRDKVVENAREVPRVSPSPSSVLVVARGFSKPPDEQHS